MPRCYTCEKRNCFCSIFDEFLLRIYQKLIKSLSNSDQKPNKLLGDNLLIINEKGFFLARA